MGYCKRYSLTAEGAVKIGDTLYFAARELNHIFWLNCNNYEIGDFVAMPDEDGITERLYNGMATNGSALLLVPYNAEKIWWYDFEKSNWESIGLERYVKPTLEGKFVGGMMTEEKAYLFGYYYEGVIAVDLKAKTIRNLLEKEPREKCSFWGQSVAYKDSNVYIANRVRNEILKIDVTNESYEVIVTPYPEDVYIGIAYDGTYFWLVPHYGSKIYRWDGAHEFKEIELFASFGHDIGFFNGICTSGQYIVLYSPRGKSCIVNKSVGTIAALEESMLFAEYFPGTGILICQVGSVSLYNEDFQLMKKIEVSINGDVYEEIVGNISLAGRKIYETRGFSLQEFLCVLQGR